MNDNKSLAARFYAAFNGQDAEEFRAILSSSWVDHPEAPGQKPGPDGLLDVVGAFHAAFEGLHITPQVMVAEGEYVVVRILIEGRHTGQWINYSPTGRQVAIAGMDKHRIENGRIVETWHFEDFSVLA